MATKIIQRGAISTIPTGEVHESIKRLLPFCYNDCMRYVLDGMGRVRIERHNFNSFSSSVCGQSELETMYKRMNLL